MYVCVCVCVTESLCSAPETHTTLLVNYVLCLIPQSCPTLKPHGLQPTRLLHPWDSPGKNTGVGCHALLQGIFPTQGSNPGLSNIK